jgi:hypothetical protein
MQNSLHQDISATDSRSTASGVQSAYCSYKQIHLMRSQSKETKPSELFHEAVILTTHENKLEENAKTTNYFIQTQEIN